MQAIDLSNDFEPSPEDRVWFCTVLQAVATALKERKVGPEGAREMVRLSVELKHLHCGLPPKNPVDPATAGAAP